jgi:outer membrane lipoprotein SlyB
MQMKNRLIAPVLLLLVAACAAPAGPKGSVVGDCANCGTVRGVDVINQGSGQASGAGAIAGAVVGAVIGHQIGSGRGQDAATAAGAVGGAAAGHQMEKSRNSGSYYRVTVDMDRGNTETVNVGDPAGLRPGHRVRVVGNNLEILS